MMKFIYLILFGNLIFAQTQNPSQDTLRKYNYLDLKNKFYDYEENNKINQSKIIAKYYLQKAKKEKDIIQIAEGYNLVHLNEDFPTALKYIDSLSIISKNIKGNLYPARIYIIKGNLNYKYDHLKAALDNYILGLKYAKEQKDEKQISSANLNIAYLNSYIGKNEDAAKTFRYYLYHTKNIADESQQHQIRVSLIYCYIELNKLDSANILIKEGQRAAIRTTSKYSTNQYYYLSGFSNLKQKKYTDALSYLSKVYKYFSTINDNNITNILLNMGQSYDGLHNKEKVVESFSKLDSIVQKTNVTYPELREVYTYLINYYKKNNNKEKQLYYIDRFLKVDQKLDEQFKYLSLELPKKYDTPNLLQEKQNIINDLENRKTILYFSISILVIVLLMLSFFYYKSKKIEKQQRKIAQDLINSIEIKSFESPTENINAVHFQETEQVHIEDKTTKVISDEVTQFILKELEVFETKELFLKKGITSANLAKNIKTNTTYLSEVINTQKEKNFAAYLNDLRVNYALNKLVKDRKFRSYKLSVIADELGYNNEQAFSLAFKKKTGTTLSIYIKEIEKSNTL